MRYGREIERTKRNVGWRHGGAAVLGGYGGFLGMDLSTFVRKKLNWGMVPRNIPVVYLFDSVEVTRKEERGKRRRKFN